MNEKTARLLLDRLRRLQDLTYQGNHFVLPDGAVSRLDEVERRLLHAIARDATGGTERDGFPSGGVGDGGEDAPQSSTEAAAWSNLGEQGAGQHDRHHELTETACLHLDRAHEAIGALLVTLDAIDKLAKIPRSDPSGWCACCGRWVEGTPRDRIVAGYCDTDYRAWLREGRPDRMAFERRRRAEAAA